MVIAQHSHISTAKYTEQRKGAWRKVQRKPGASFQALSPTGGTQDVLNSSCSELWQHAKCCLSRKVNRDSAFRVLIRGQSHKHPLPSTYQNSTFSEGKQVSKIQFAQIVQAQGASVIRVAGTLPKSKFPDASLASRPFLVQQAQVCSF